jgi:hypothetical protein
MQRSGTSPDLSGFVQAATGGFWAKLSGRDLSAGRLKPTQQATDKCMHDAGSTLLERLN